MRRPHTQWTSRASVPFWGGGRSAPEYRCQATESGVSVSSQQGRHPLSSSVRGEAPNRSSCNLPITGCFPSGPNGRLPPRQPMPPRSRGSYSLGPQISAPTPQPQLPANPPQPRCPPSATPRASPTGAPTTGRSGRAGRERRVCSLPGALCPDPGSPGPRSADDEGRGSEVVGGDGVAETRERTEREERNRGRNK